MVPYLAMESSKLLYIGWRQNMPMIDIVWWAFGLQIMTRFYPILKQNQNMYWVENIIWCVITWFDTNLQEINKTVCFNTFNTICWLFPSNFSFIKYPYKTISCRQKNNTLQYARIYCYFELDINETFTWYGIWRL